MATCRTWTSSRRADRVGRPRRRAWHAGAAALLLAACADRGTPEGRWISADASVALEITPHHVVSSSAGVTAVSRYRVLARDGASTTVELLDGAGAGRFTLTLDAGHLIVDGGGGRVRFQPAPD